MSEHISKSGLFCNKRNTVKSSTLHQNITILEMSCEYKKNMRIGSRSMPCISKKNYLHICTSSNYFIVIVK